MPPKRKRTEADTQSTTTRPTKKTPRTTREKNGAATSLSDTVEPPPKRTRAKGRGTMRGVVIDDPSDDELDIPKRALTTGEVYSQQCAQALFKTFADSDNPEVIGPGGVEKLCTEAGIPLDSAQPLILAWQFKAQEMAKLTRSEWLQGTEALRISSLPILALVLKELDDLVVHCKGQITPVSSVSSIKKRAASDYQEPYDRSRYLQYTSDCNAAFTELYQFCFTLSKPQQSRNLDIETAMALWSVLLTSRYPIVTELVMFLSVSQSGSYKGANKDIWNMVYEFCRTINDELSNYEADGAWPTMLDDFVAWKRDRMAPPTNDTPQ